ncbi:unnamed protein product [Arctogadus glacialis]
MRRCRRQPALSFLKAVAATWAAAGCGVRSIPAQQPGMSQGRQVFLYRKITVPPTICYPSCSPSGIIHENYAALRHRRSTLCLAYGDKALVHWLWGWNQGS